MVQVGWRGFALQRLLAITGSPLLSSVVLGVMWALWHLPIFYWNEYPLVVDRAAEAPFYVFCYCLGLSSLSMIMTGVFIATGGSILPQLVCFHCIERWMV